MDWNTIQQIVRIAAQWIAAYLVTSGAIASSMESMVSGALISAAALAWWFIWARKQENPVPPTV